MDNNTVIGIIVPVAILVLGYLFERRRDREAKIHERKENLYKNLVFTLKGFFTEKEDANLREQFIDETRLARLYACDEAIIALNRFLDIMMKSESEIQEKTGRNYQEVVHKALGKFMRAMRRDLGIKTKLTTEELGRTEGHK